MSRRSQSFPWYKFYLPLLMLAVLPILSEFLKNRFQVSAQDLVLPLILNLIIASLVALVFWRPWQRQPLSYFGAIAAVIILTNDYGGRLEGIYPVIKALAPLPSLGSAESLVFSMLLIVSLIVGLIGLSRGLTKVSIRRKWPTAEIVTAASIAITVTFLFQVIPAVRALAGTWPQYFYRPPALPALASQPVDRPDIYYLVLDRYASQTVLKDQFNFDNNDFLGYLKGQQYFLNLDSHNNYPYTTMSIASTLNANYLTDSINRFKDSKYQTVQPYHDSIMYAAVTKQLQAQGYKYHHIGSWYDATNRAPLANQRHQVDGELTILNQHFGLSNFAQNELKQSAFWNLIKHGGRWGGFTWFGYANTGPLDLTTYGLDQLEELAKQPAGGRFIFAHLLIPHDPYFFNADGSLAVNADSNNVNRPIKQKYLGQVQYINSKMKSLLTKINQSSQNQAVVVLQADEGPYPIQLNDENFSVDTANEEINNQDMQSWSDLNLKMKFGNLAAYHIPKATPGDLAAGADPVNVFRIILNRYFGGQLEYLPRCSYAYPNGRDRPFVYTDITKRLTGQNSPCAN